MFVEEASDVFGNVLTNLTVDHVKYDSTEHSLRAFSWTELANDDPVLCRKYASLHHFTH